MVQLILCVISIFDEFEFDASDGANGGALNAWFSPFVSSIGLVFDRFLVHPE